MKSFSGWIDFFIHRTRLVNGISVAITIAGLIALYFTQRDLHPPFQLNEITVSAVLESASSEEIERLVTYPLEEALQGLPDVEEVRSRSKAGSMWITLRYPQKVKDLSERIEVIRGRVQVATRDLPQAIRDIRVERNQDNSIFLANIGVIGIDPKSHDHHRFVDLLQTQIKSVKGVIQTSSSLPHLQIFIRFEPKKLARSGLTVLQLRSAIRAELDPSSIGYNAVDGREWLLEFASVDMTPERVGAIPLFKNAAGHKLLLRDVATVQYDFERSEKYHFLLNGSPAVEVDVKKSVESDSILVFRELQAKLKELKPPPGVEVRVLYDGPYFINQQIQVLLSNGFGGLILVLLMLAWAMSWKTSMMTALGLPISYFGTFIVLKLLGISIDLISLIGMILVVGNLVDDAVIFAERYNQLLSEGQTPEKSASQAAHELIVPVTGTILTIICAFIPILLVDGELSVIFKAIPVVIASALILSWLETFFILPNHLAHHVRTPPRERSLAFFHKMARQYKVILAHTLRFRYLYGLGSLGLLGFSLWTASRMPQDFSLYINAAQVEVFVTFVDEPSYEEVTGRLRNLHQQLISKIPQAEVDFIETNLGLVYRENKMYRGPKYATLRLVLNRELVEVSDAKKRILAKVNEVLAAVEVEKAKEVVALETQRGSGSRRQNITSIEIKGRDERSFNLARQKLIASLAGNGLVGAYVPPDNHGPTTFQFQPKFDQLRLYEISKQDLAFQIQAQTGSVELLRGRDSGRWMKVMLEPEGMTEPRLADLSSLAIQSPSHGDALPLQYLGEWQSVGYSDGIFHRGGERNLTLDFRFDGEKTNEKVVQKEVLQNLVAIQSAFPSLNIRSIDANEADKKGREWTAHIVWMAAVLIYIILALALRSFTQPLIVGLPMPFALMGVIWALKAHGMPLGLMSMIGLIGTMGVAVNDSIVMVDHINRLWREAGRRTKDLILEGAASRVRAIFLTATCTLIGVFPTAYGIGGESGFTQPLAFSMGWGLTASLLLTLFIIPAMLMVLEDISATVSRLRNRFKQGRAVPPVSQSETERDHFLESSREVQP